MKSLLNFFKSGNTKYSKTKILMVMIKLKNTFRTLFSLLIGTNCSALICTIFFALICTNCFALNSAVSLQSLDQYIHEKNLVRWGELMTAYVNHSPSHRKFDIDSLSLEYPIKTALNQMREQCRKSRGISIDCDPKTLSLLAYTVTAYKHRLDINRNNHNQLQLASIAFPVALSVPFILLSDCSSNKPAALPKKVFIAFSYFAYLSIVISAGWLLPRNVYNPNDIDDFDHHLKSINDGTFLNNPIKIVERYLAIYSQ